MGQCQHRYQHEHAACPHPTAPDSDRCIWHNPLVAKNDRYVAGLLAHVDHLGHGDLAEFHLAGLLWPEAALTGRRLADADLRDAVLDGADLSGADLSRARLRRASFKNANLRGARLPGADLSATNLIGADLRDCDLRRSVLSGTVLMGCDLRGADFTGASISGFQWNNLTRFAGIKGLDTAGIIGDDDDTRPFLDGVHALSLKAGQVAVSPLADPEPQAMRTRSYAAAGRGREPSALVPLTPGGGVRRLRRWRAACLVSLCGMLLALTFAGWSYQRAQLSQAGGQHLLQVSRERDALRQQGEAYAAQLRAAEARAGESSDGLARLRQSSEVVKAETESLRSALRDSAAEAVRLRDRDDRAALLALRLAESEEGSRHLAEESVRQERLNRILGDGLGRLRAEKEAMLKEREATVIAGAAVAKAEAEATRLRDQAAQAQRVSHDLHAANQRLTGELLAAQRDIERYLARVSGSSLHDYLVADEAASPLVAVVAGEPIALGGDFLVTLRLDPVPNERAVQARVVVQRPGGGADPDLSLVLYDEARRPLRRVAYSFPHRDGGGPFTAATTIFSCDRFPAFVRILVQPGGAAPPATARK